ncbi:MAG: hypothetical protein ACP5N7_04420 [Candidatus Pacearchaeota archaeon]
MNKLFLVLFLGLFLVSFTSAQEVYGDPNFIPFSSEQAGSVEFGCMAACMTSMLASLNDSAIGTNTTRIFSELNSTMRLHSSDYPYHTYVIINAAVRFLSSL